MTWVIAQLIKQENSRNVIRLIKLVKCAKKDLIWCLIVFENQIDLFSDTATIFGDYGMLRGQIRPRPHASGELDSEPGYF